MAEDAATKLVGLTAKKAEASTPAPATKLVGLGAKPAPSAQPEPSAPAPATKLVGLGAKATPSAQPEPSAPALVGLGAKAASTPPSPADGMKLTGLGAAQPADASAPAPAPARRSGIEIDPSAAERIKALLGERNTPDAGLRIRVRSGGCTGLQYDMEFVEAPREKDRLFEGHGVKIFVDPKSYIFLIGTVLTYQQTLLESGFKLENPNVKKSCGCGESFTV